MRNLFDPSVLGWPQLRDSLHVYVIPDQDFASTAQPAMDVIARFDICATVASQWRHATITRIPWWRNEVDEQRLLRFSRTLDALAAETSAFTLTMTGPVVHENSVGMDAPSDGQWQRLLDGTRSAAEQVFGAERPPAAAPDRPHVSLGYGIIDADSAALQLALEPIDIDAELTVDAMHFVAVHQDPTAGTFTWDPISIHRLQSPR
ncbi:2'-5' RNA ligase family protein [Nocardia sp. XZ_19_385]|uniref:2'-5' RNA ligase family protein n=1 Tax=Nocardia sp. XZ_19_385 TaxID=2769488 RepID=UPI00188ED5BD|nr:2'-5' RNA ligase family protein [Nocardia sp. XZ_19_385]